MNHKECGFCGRALARPLKEDFCCTSCSKAYMALHPPPAKKRETEKPKKTAGRTRKKVKTRHVRKQRSIGR